MNFITSVFLFYMFLALFMFFFFIFLYIRNRKTLFEYPKPKKLYTVSVLIPAYNEEECIAATIEQVFKSSYKGLLEVIVINDGSTDNTASIVKRLMKKYKRLKLINKKNTGKADSLNQGLKKARGELVVVVDADSFPEREAISRMVGFFNDERVAAVTASILVKNKKRFLEKLQAIQYIIIAWTRKLLDYIDAVYVTPGALSMYRKNAVLKVGGFDPNNLTEDIELTWHLINEGYKTRMCLAAKCKTIVPSRFRRFYEQRIRWNIGGIQTINKYKKAFVTRGGVASFILPFFLIGLIVGLFGFGIFIYLLFKKFILTYLKTTYIIGSNLPLVTMEDISFNITVLNFFGIVMFFLSLAFLLFGLRVMRRKERIKQNVFNMMFYMFIYAMIHPPMLVAAMWRLVRGKKRW